MDFLNRYCRLKARSLVENSLKTFSCGDKDLDEFFKKDSPKYEYELFGKTYCFQHKNNDIVGLFTLSNGGIQSRQMKNNLRRKISQPKRLVHNYPSVLIGRLAISSKYQGMNIGSEILNFLKIWFSDIHNKTGCRFLAVDAYNKDQVINFYSKNEFNFIFKSEEEERSNLHLNADESLITRMMCFDLFPYSLALCEK